jgi:hypothetical protein
MGNSPAVIDRFYKGAIGKVEVEEFWNIRPDSDTPSGTKKCDPRRCNENGWPAHEPWLDVGHTSVFFCPNLRWRPRVEFILRTIRPKTEESRQACHCFAYSPAVPNS